MATGESEKGAFAKGDRAKIVAGKKGIGVEGEIFWTGENKYGSGLRYGLRGDDGETYWVDESQISPSQSTPTGGGSGGQSGGSARSKPTGGAGSGKFDKGDEVEMVRGPQTGQRGVIFWTGQSRYGDGSRYGFKNSDDQTIWADEPEVKLISKGAGQGAGTQPSRNSGPPRSQGAADPGASDANSDLPPEAFAGPTMSLDDLPDFDDAEGDSALPPEAFEQAEEWRQP